MPTGILETPTDVAGSDRDGQIGNRKHCGREGSRLGWPGFNDLGHGIMQLPVTI
jgi:hypothetical protein